MLVNSGSSGETVCNILIGVEIRTHFLEICRTNYNWYLDGPANVEIYALIYKYIDPSKYVVLT